METWEFYQGIISAECTRQPFWGNAGKAPELRAAESVDEALFLNVPLRCEWHRSNNESTQNQEGQPSPCTPGSWWETGSLQGESFHVTGASVTHQKVHARRQWGPEPEARWSHILARSLVAVLCVNAEMLPLK